MKKLGLAVLVLSLLFVSSAFAADLSGIAVTDDAFDLYLSTSDTTAGTLIGSSSDWHTPLTFASVGSLLGASGTYYLHAEGRDLAQWVAGFLGDFTLTGKATFSNGTQHLLTNTTDWKVGDSWTTMTQTPTLVTQYRDASDTLHTGTTGLNGSQPWGTVGGISSAAGWIWTNNGDYHDTPRFFTTKITVTPEPVSMVLFGLGIGVLGLAQVRRKKK